MKILCLLTSVLFAGCTTKTICSNSEGGFNSVLDPQKNCSVRIKKVIVASDINLPKSISFKDSTSQWTYRWVDSKFQDGVLELGHFVLIPMGSEVPVDGK